MPQQQRRRVLVVEDNPDGRESLRILLELWGCQVDVAQDGLEGLRKVLAWKPDVAILDVGLPYIDGYRIARTVRQSGSHILLIALTAYSERDNALAAGFDEHISKPADLDRLMRLVAC
jgi:CheY-like chemotaxis protein